MFSSRLLHQMRSIKTKTNSMASKAADPKMECLRLKDGRTLAYEKLSSNSKSKTVIFIPGFQSGNNGPKVSSVRKLCLDNDFAFIRYGSSPLTVCGESGGKVDLGDWLRTAGTVLDRLGSDDNVLVGCSVGGWVSLWLASQEQFAHKISAVVVVSPAVNFLKQVVYLQIDGFEDLALRKSFTEKSDHYRHKFSHQQSINVKCPVTILHGVKDQTVPFTNSIRIMNKLKTDDVEVIFSKTADCDFSDANSLRILSSAVKKMVMMKKMK